MYARREGVRIFLVDMFQSKVYSDYPRTEDDLKESLKSASTMLPLSREELG